MKIRDGLPDARIADFEECLSQLPVLLNCLEEPVNGALLANTLTAETLALTLLTFGGPDAARHYLQKPSSRLSGNTPLLCIKESDASRDVVIRDLFRIIEGYVF